MHRINLNNEEFTGPSKWEELDASGLISIAAVLQTAQSPRVTNHLLAMRLFGVPQKKYQKLKECQKVQLDECVSWLHSKNTLQNWLLKVIKVGGTTVYGPQNRLSTMTAGEFMYAEAAYERWLQGENPMFLDSLFAVLYRRRRWYLRIRKPFSPEKMDNHEKLARSLKLYVKKAVALNYAGCRNLIIDKYPNVWKKSKEKRNQTLIGPKITNWAGIILDLSGDKFGTYEQTLKTNIWLLLADLDKKAKNAADLGGPRS